MSARTVRVLTAGDVRSLMPFPRAIEAARAAFVALHHGTATTAAPIGLRIEPAGGEVHVKAGHNRAADTYAVKVASAFPGNAQQALSVIGGMTVVFDARTGAPTTLMLDDGLLTDLRTAAAGAVATDALAAAGATEVAVLGTGQQARLQVEALTYLRSITHVTVWGRRLEAAQRCASDIAARTGLPTSVAQGAHDAVRQANIVITATAATEPILDASLARPGLHITAVGSDLPDKAELDPALVAGADRYVPDSPAQCLDHGELRLAAAAGLVKPDDITVDLPALLADPSPRDPEAFTIADLTGLGALDAEIAHVCATEAARQGAGRLT
ncbi:ornithine cyclodeaminase family protein [Amycolatopsis taiwanensis]|uniref:ornithine cyclodeaminase family protein n=1 Tax=Amycolatopsis taiwanensis TaxID=342230 RepID=UPI0004B6104D|nr:hypothetical protein [Amycolatopsis taiwanensis]